MVFSYAGKMMNFLYWKDESVLLWFYLWCLFTKGNVDDYFCFCFVNETNTSYRKKTKNETKIRLLEKYI